MPAIRRPPPMKTRRPALFVAGRQRSSVDDDDALAGLLCTIAGPPPSRFADVEPHNFMLERMIMKTKDIVLFEEEDETVNYITSASGHVEEKKKDWTVIIDEADELFTFQGNRLFKEWGKYELANAKYEKIPHHSVVQASSSTE